MHTFHWLKFIKKRLKNSNMFRSTTIIRELQCPCQKLPEIRLQHVTKIYSSFDRIWIFSRRIVLQWVMNMEKVSIKTFLQWRRDIKRNGTVLCSPTTAGLWQGMPLPWNTSDGQNEQKNYVILFVLNNELTWKRLCKCSIYVLNIIPKQNKSTKHILIHWVVFRFFIYSTASYNISTYFVKYQSVA